MAVLRAQVCIDRDTSLPEDVTVNTFHFATIGDFVFDGAEVTAIHAALTTFYQSIDQYLSPVLKEVANVKYYDIGAPQPNPPRAVKPLTLTLGASTTPLPEEVAVCLSFKADPVSGAVAGRRRGRVYIGPLTTGLVAVSNGRVMVTPTFQQELANAGTALLAASDAQTAWKWVIYSPTSHQGGTAPDTAVFPVQQGWVDNAFDTQRRRGPVAQHRWIFGV